MSEISFDCLPLRKDGPPGNAWGRFGDDDELGTLNLITPQVTAEAAKEIVDGFRVSIDWPLNSMATPCFGRKALVHEIQQKGERIVNDDVLTLNTQSSSQWDGHRHYGYQKHKVFYNGLTEDEVMKTQKNGIHAWVDKGGIVGRGVLLDYVSWAEDNNVPVDCFTPTSIPISILKEIAAKQRTTFRPGDILFVRTGWTEAYGRLNPTDKVTYATTTPLPAIGVESSKETLRWIWDHKFSAVAGDHPSFEAAPFQTADYILHEWLLAGWGMPIGELFDLKQLSEECKKRRRWEFFFSSMPLRVPGGVASPPNGVAVF